MRKGLQGREGGGVVLHGVLYGVLPEFGQYVKKKDRKNGGYSVSFTAFEGIDLKGSIFAIK